jgi:hypothetical protein
MNLPKKNIPDAVCIPWSDWEEYQRLKILVEKPSEAFIAEFEKGIHSLCNAIRESKKIDPKELADFIENRCKAEDMWNNLQQL